MVLPWSTQRTDCANGRQKWVKMPKDSNNAHPFALTRLKQFQVLYLFMVACIHLAKPCSPRGQVRAQNSKTHVLLRKLRSILCRFLRVYAMSKHPSDEYKLADPVTKSDLITIQLLF